MLQTFASFALQHKEKVRHAAVTLVPISSLKRSSCCWPMTRVLPNHRRSGCIRVLGSSLDCKSCRENSYSIPAQA